MKVREEPTTPGFHKIELAKGEAIRDPSKYHGPNDPSYIYGPEKIVWRRYPSGAVHATLVDVWPDE